MPKTDASFDPSRYATVAQRIALFYNRHPGGRIETDLVSRDAESVTFRARVYRDASDTVPAATGWATEREGDGDINTVACLENTETSAIGRALANLGYTASRERPSLEEMKKVQRARDYRARVTPSTSTARVAEPESATPQALSDLFTLLGCAERAGLGLDRAARLRRRLERDTTTSDRVRELERSLRRWLARHEDVTAPRLSP